MSIFNPLARALWSGGGNEELENKVKALEDAYEELDLFAHPFEKITEDGTDKLGDYVFVEQGFTPNPQRSAGYFRLRPNVRAMADLAQQYGEACDFTEMTQETRVMTKNGNYKSPSLCNGATRVIFPETMPNSIYYDGGINEKSIPTFGSIPPVSAFLPKHTANNANNSNWISGNPSANVTEQIIIAPEGMDAPLHLHKFNLMSVDTIVAILENLADVRDRENPPTLTLGGTNLAKLTEAQIAIAEEKGWNLA